uniref:Uncharacterized protein n=1 Tax=Parascaris univalens TaxID=6257 RepID=A0A915BB71_PARUN
MTTGLRNSLTKICSIRFRFIYSLIFAPFCFNSNFPRNISALRLFSPAYLTHIYKSPVNIFSSINICSVNYLQNQVILWPQLNKRLMMLHCLKLESISVSCLIL